MNRLIGNGISEKAMDRFFKAIKKQEIDLHSMEIWRQGEQVFSAYGYPFTPETMHRMYSSGKMLVSLAVMKAVEAGEISLDDKVISYFPGRLPEDMDEKYQQLTVYHMLCMNTGHDHDTMWEMRSDPDWIHGFFKQELACAPGELFFYNNGVPYILTQIVKAAVHMDYMEYLDLHFFKAMDVRTEADRTPQGDTDPSGVSIRMGDFPKLARLLLNKGEWEGRALLDPRLAEMMGQYQVSSIQLDKIRNVALDTKYGYGFFLWRNSVGGFRLDGGRGQFGMVFPDLDMTVSFMSFEEDQGLIPELFWKMVYPFLWKKSAPDSERADGFPGKGYEALPDWGRTYHDKRDIDGCTYVLEENEMGLEEIRFDISEKEILFSGSQRGKNFCFKAGLENSCCINDSFPDLPESNWFMDHVSGNQDGRYYIRGEFYLSEDFAAKREIRIFVRNLQRTQYWVWNCRIADGGIRIEVDHGSWYCVRNRGRLELLPHIPDPVMIYGSRKEREA